MKSLFKWVLLVLIAFSGSATVALAATILTTATTDTIETFRTNVNTSLTNLNNGLASAVADLTTLGLGTTTPWGQLSVASTSVDYTRPLFVVATSSQPSGYLFGAFATSTTLRTTRTVLEATSTDPGVRLGIGTNTTHSFPGLLDQVTVMGRVNTVGWQLATCESPVATTISADTAVACGNFAWMEDGTGVLSASADNGYGYNTLGVSATAVNDGNGLFNSIFNYLATTTPVFEATARINNTQFATSTAFYVGFTNLSISGTAFEVTPTAGCYFTASSTQANWKAVCSYASTQTIVDTGFASSTALTGAGDMRRFRIEATGSLVRFYMEEPATPMRQVAAITTNIPTTNDDPLVGGAYFSVGATGASGSRDFNVGYIKVWSRNALIDK